jgi:hypothetical protein
MDKNQQVIDVINKCGGMAKVSIELGIVPTTILNWQYRFQKIPRKYWEALYKMSNGTVSLEELAGWD